MSTSPSPTPRQVSRPVSPPVSRATYWKRRAGVALTVLGVALLLVLGSGYGGAEADLVHPDIAGHATVAPGQTLWDVAVTNAPEGVDPRTYLSRIRDVNDLDGSSVPAWTVVLLPAH